MKRLLPLLRLLLPYRGRLALEIRSQVAQDRGTFGVTGTVSRPIIKRGG